MPFDLASLDAEYQKTEAPAKKEYDNVPDGKYEVIVYKVDPKEASTGAPMLAFQLKIISGEHAGRLIFRNMVFSAGSLPYCKSDLHVLGFDGQLSELETIPGRMKLLDRAMAVTVKTKDGANGKPNTNVYFNKAISAHEIAAAQPPF